MIRFLNKASGRPWGRAVGGLIFALICASWLTLTPTLVLAHGGEDHDHAAPASIAVQGSPRVVAQSDLYQVVGILRDTRLTLYLDQIDDNAPVADAKVTVKVDDVEAVAQPTTDGTYTVSSPRFGEAGTVDVVVSVSGPAGDDLLIGTLVVPAHEAVTPSNHPAVGTTPALPLQRLQALLGPPDAARTWLVAIFGVGLGIGLVLRSWRLHPAAIVAGAVLVVALTGTAFAHGGEDHDHATPAIVPGSNTPQRLPDGAVFVPKPSQRILDVRTKRAQPSAVEGATRLIGKVIADPNRGGLVQSIGGGRVIAPETGMPQLGKSVKKGDVLAQIERPFVQADQAMVTERLGEIEQLIGLAEARLARAKRLVITGAATAISVSDLEIELEGLRRRRATVTDVRGNREILIAPADGLIAASRVVAGQVVQPQDVLFQVVDPKSLWIEALSYDEGPPVGSATALTAEGLNLVLEARGISRTLQQQATVLQFAVLDPPASLRVGQPITVLAKTGSRTDGIVLPREAVVRGAGGEAMVWRHVDPERFEPRQVRTEPLDASRLIVRAGLKDGDRIVVRGADLINQIR